MAEDKATPKKAATKAAKPAAKKAVKKAAKPAAKAAVKKAAAKPEVKAVAKPEVKAVAKPEIKAVAKPEIKAAAKPVAGKVSVTLIRSKHGRLASHKACIAGLGLRRMHQTVEVIDTPENRGMINKVQYLLNVEEA
jgi:large subunit ribosomal protein L30